jgi:predicted esterase/predicted Ser/Thr protein kinase
MNLATETAFTGAEPVTAQPPLSLADLAPHFPQLEILECLGRGGMGVVYKVSQKSLDRVVALKLLAPERVLDSKFAARFANEAQALARLNHPNIVTVYDFGQAGGFYYLLMEFVDGVNLRQLLRSRKLTPEEALAIVPPLCEAMQFAHEHGIIHRDIKPENLLLDKEGRVKIADFGIAKMLGAGASNVGLLETQPAGTPGYMAPEQKTEPQKADSRADIYSLGVVFYEMLTGELPADKLEPPSRKVRIDVRLDEIVLRALESTPEMRFQTAAELRTQVEAVVNPARGMPATNPPHTPQKRNPAWALFGVSAAVALIAVFVGWFVLGAYQARRAMAAEQNARARAQQIAAERASLTDGGEAPADIADIPMLDRRAGGDEMKRFLLIGLRDGQTAPKAGYRLLIVMPGGAGDANFSPFVRRIYKHVLDQNWLIAQLVAPQWDEAQARNLVWPTAGDRYPAARFTTEQFVTAVVAEISKQHSIDPRCVFTLSWSSGGPAAYAVSLDPATRVTGSFIAMSVFRPEKLPDLAPAKGRLYYLLHSPKDFISIKMPETAKELLQARGARVEFQTYEGGHGWHGDVYGQLRRGIEWLTKEAESLPALREDAP